MNNELLPSFYADQICEEVKEVERLRRMFILFNGLNGRLVAEGNQWCAITGEMPVNYLAGFGDTPHIALSKWEEEYWTNKIVTPKP